MSWAAKLTREELIEDIEILKDNSESHKHRDNYLKNAVHSLDIEFH